MTNHLICNYSGLPSVLSFMQEEQKAAALPQLHKNLSAADIDRIIEMAWEDRTPFDAIKLQFGYTESEVKAIMKKHLRFSSYKTWRKRVETCKTKHKCCRHSEISRFKSSRQKNISANKISKR